MALRTKTIEYAFPQYTGGLAAATRYEFSEKTLYIPESSSRTFKSVMLQFYVRDDVTTSTAIGSRTLEIKLGAVAFDAATATNWISTTPGDHVGYFLQRTVTSYFASNFGSGTSQTCQAAITLNPASNNISCKLIITYEYDDSSATTRVKTVRIPLDGATTRLTDTLAELGTNQVPALDTFLPEASKSIKDIFFEVYSQEYANATTDFQLGLALDSESEVLDGNHEQAQNTGLLYYRIWQRNDMTTNAAHAFKARSTLTGTFDGFTVVLVVTYEYNHSTSTTIMNSLVLGLTAHALPLMTTNVIAAAHRLQKKFFVEEPTTITLAQSGIVGMYSHYAGGGTMNVRAGSQSARSYGTVVSQTHTGSRFCSQRIDSGGVQGAGMTLARGENTLTVDYMTGGGSDAGGQTGTLAVSFYAILNYTSGKHSNGDGVHNHSTFFQIKDPDTETATYSMIVASFAPYISSTNYYVNDMTVARIRYNIGQADFIVARSAAGEGIGSTFHLIAANCKEMTDGGQSSSIAYYAVDPSFRRFPSDLRPGPGMVPTVARTWNFNVNSNQATIIPTSYMAGMWMTHHAITFSVAKTVTGYGGSGVGIGVNIRRDDTDEVIGRVSTTSGGSYSFTWYDDTIDLIADAREDGTHVGRSDNFRAS